MSTMTLEQAIRIMNPEPKSHEGMEAWQVVKAHLAQPAQAVDVGAIREVIAYLKVGHKKDMAGKLTRAIGSAQPEE
jgi:hypothetical protein